MYPPAGLLACLHHRMPPTAHCIHSSHRPTHLTPFCSGDTFLSVDQVVPYCLALLEVFR